MGDLIASVQTLPQKHDIIFFERNGLRHREFSLRDDCDVIDLSWNAGSDVLSLLLKKRDTEVLFLSFFFNCFRNTLFNSGQEEITIGISNMN